MTKRHSLLPAILTLLFLLAGLVLPASANSAEPPNIIILVPNPPEDLSLTISFPDMELQPSLVLEGDSRGWERYYRFFSHELGYDADKLSDAQVIAEAGGETYYFPLFAKELRQYNGIFTLDLSGPILERGAPVWRIPLLVALRVISTLLIEGAIFFLFGYRKKESWLAFLGANLVTQTGLNLLFTGPYLGYGWGLVFLGTEAIILVGEMVFFSKALTERPSARGAVYAAAANLASLLLGMALLSLLPV